MTAANEPDPFAKQLEEARTGIEAAGRIDPYNHEVLRMAYLGASALIDGSNLKPVEQITHRKEIAQLAGKLATDHDDETTATEMEARVDDCDAILKLIQPQEDGQDEDTPATPAPKKKGTAKKADTSAAKTSGAKGQ